MSRLLAVVQVLCAGVLMVAAAGCGSSSGEPSTTPAETGSPQPGAQAPSAEESSSQDPRVAAAIGDLSDRAGVTPEDVTVVSHLTGEWSDPSLGCPDPDRMYPTVMTEGEQLILQAEGSEYHYHAAASDDFFYCEDPGGAFYPAQ